MRPGIGPFSRRKRLKKMSKKNSNKGTQRKRLDKKKKRTKGYAPIAPQAYDLVAVAIASDTRPINQELAEQHALLLESRLLDLYSKEGGGPQEYNGASDTALMLKVAIDAELCQDEGGLFDLIRKDLNAAVEAYHASGRYRMPIEGKERVMGMVDAIRELFQNIPERTFISLHRATTTVKRALQRGEITDVNNLKEMLK